jgi:hypothetical protein
MFPYRVTQQTHSISLLCYSLVSVGLSPFDPSSLQARHLWASLEEAIVLQLDLLDGLITDTLQNSCGATEAGDDVAKGSRFCVVFLVRLFRQVGCDVSISTGLPVAQKLKDLLGQFDWTFLDFCLLQMLDRESRTGISGGFLTFGGQSNYPTRKGNELVLVFDLRDDIPPGSIATIMADKVLELLTIDLDLTRVRVVSKAGHFLDEGTNRLSHLSWRMIRPSWQRKAVKLLREM